MFCSTSGVDDSDEAVYMRIVLSSGEITLKKTPAKHVPPPHGLEIVKCSAYGAFTRSFVKFVITDQIAKDLLEWAKAVFSPDELYWATLNYNTLVQAPGGFKGEYTPCFTANKSKTNAHQTTTKLNDFFKNLKL